MHIHPSSPNSSIQSEENAAIKIQAGFRGYRVRKQLNYKTRCTTNGYHPTRSTTHRRYQRQQETMENQNGVNFGNSTSASNVSSSAAGANTVNNSVEDRCATKIQAGVRGFLVRKKQKIATDAATKIQASFRGFKVRKDAQKLKQK